MTDLTPEARREIKLLASTAAAKQFDRWMLIVIVAGLVGWSVREWVLEEPEAKTVFVQCKCVADDFETEEGTTEL